jgi:hypothetical protein
MSLMAETSQSAMGPYVAIAAVLLALNALAAVSRKALIAKVPGGDDGGGLGEGGGGLGEGGGGLGGCVGGLGGEGQLSVEFGQSPLYAIASSSKAGVPAHAQRMSSLLASDKELFAPCRESKGGRV